eukprot:scaffold194171_cov37-Prasinocladus_malaysianus.AAC.1
MGSSGTGTALVRYTDRRAMPHNAESKVTSTSLSAKPRWGELPQELVLPVARLQATGPELLNLALVCKSF